MGSTASTPSTTRLVELRRHQTYRLERPQKNRWLGLLRRGTEPARRIIAAANAAL